MGHTKTITSLLNINTQQVRSTVDLLDDGNTIPFIARYRKEHTNNLDEVQIRKINELLVSLRALDTRRETILKTIQKQGKLTGELKLAILKAETRTALEDLYLPFKPRRKSRASKAQENGLKPLADLILKPSTNYQKQSLDILAKSYLSENITSIEDAWAGARDIVAEIISNHVKVRQLVRKKAAKWGNLKAEKINKSEDLRGVYKTYYNFSCRVNRLQPYQILAINRGEREKILRVNIFTPERDWRDAVTRYFAINDKNHLGNQLVMAIDDAAKRLLLPAIARDIRRDLTEKSEKHAINVFSTNLRALLIQPPLRGHTVIGIDPGYRSGCKIAVVDNTGMPLETATIFPFRQGSKEKSSVSFVNQSQATLKSLIDQHSVSLIAIGNGTASRETEQFISDQIQKSYPNIQYIIINEAGASVYSASKLARAELPSMDVTLRGAVSIARRAQDPLAELVKIDPKSIGVGMYQHDVDQKVLDRSLDAVVESVVNQIGVDLNTSSPALLTHIAGIGPKLAERIVAYRNQHGAFRNRKALINVQGLGPKAFQQAAGFLRVFNGNNPLDASAIHPESYTAAKAILELSNLSAESHSEMRETILTELKSPSSLTALTQSLNTGISTLEDIIDQLIQPDRDPRKELRTPLLHSSMLKIEDLAKGMQLKGTVRNVVDFGAFVDIGVKIDGLLHRSRIPRTTHLSVGDVIQIEILDIELDRGRLSLGFLPSSTSDTRRPHV